MAWKSPTDVNVSGGMDNILPYLSEVTNFWFGRMFLIALFVIFFIGYLRSNENDYIGGFAVSSYVTFVLAVFLWILNLVSGWALGFAIGVSVISTLMLLFQKK